MPCKKCLFLPCPSLLSNCPNQWYIKYTVSASSKTNNITAFYYLCSRYNMSNVICLLLQSNTMHVSLTIMWWRCKPSPPLLELCFQIPPQVDMQEVLRKQIVIFNQSLYYEALCFQRLWVFQIVSNSFQAIQLCPWESKLEHQNNNIYLKAETTSS
jgi:hypothetical protein